MYRLKKAIVNRMNYFISLPAIIWQILFLWLPFLIVISASVYTRSIGFTFSFYKTLFTGAHARIILRSLIMAFCNTMACLIVAYPVAYFISFRAQKLKNLMIFFVTFPFLVNFLVHIYAWFFILERNGLFNKLLQALHIIREPLHIMNSLFAIAIVMFQIYLPFMILPIYVVFEKFDLQLIEASMDLGASKRETFLRVTFPLTLSGAKLGFFLVFGMSFGEYIVPQLLNGGKFLFVGTLISDYFTINRDFATGAAFTCLSACVLLMVMSCCLLIFGLVKKGVK